MAKEKDHKPRVEILLDSPYLFLKGVGVDVEPTTLSGHVAIYLSEATPLKEITLQFRGEARLPVPASESMTLNGVPLTYVVCQHDWSFLEGEKNSSHTLKAGRHLFPFQLRIGGSLPSTIASPAFGGAAVSYKLRAQVVRGGFFHQTYHAGLPVHIIRSFAPEAMEYQQTLEIENTWPEKLMYSLMIPHKAWAAGDKLTALVKFTPLTKGTCVLSVTTAIHEQTKVYARSGPQEQTRQCASVKHEIVNGRAVEVEGHRGSRSPSHPPSPASPASPSPGASQSHIQRSGSSSSLSSLSRHLIHNPLHAFTPTAHSSTSASASASTPSPETPPVASSSNAPRVETEDSDYESQDVVTYLSIPIPLTITPSHNLEPIHVAHRIRWSILILNADGHTSELRCSLPLHLLDYRLLHESKNFSAATRRLLIGGAEVSQEEEDVQLPSYTQHVRDRVANMYLPDSATMRVTNPWITQRTSPVHPVEAPITPWPISLSGTSTPLEAHLLAHLPHQPDPSAAIAPLEWVNSELLLSLSENPPPRLRARTRNPSPHRESDMSSEPHSRSHSPVRHSRPGSRALSRISSRATSPERQPDSNAHAHGHAHAHAPGHGQNHSRNQSHSHSHGHAHAHETYVHSHGQASRGSHGLFSTTMKPLTSFTSGFHLPRSASQQHLPSPAELEAVQRPVQLMRQITLPDAETGTELLHRAFTEVPDYSVASRGFIGGVPPLTSMQGLPSYDETIRQSGEEMSRRSSGELTPSDSEAVHA
ncbi:hypothetical protein H0H92_001215 [Tricholoma furcatifolium]|nr:hypothetical protein H0H92_001215 [Tricholoma furcatifolium]